MGYLRGKAPKARNFFGCFLHLYNYGILKKKRAEGANFFLGVLANLKIFRVPTFSVITPKSRFFEFEKIIGGIDR